MIQKLTLPDKIKHAIDREAPASAKAVWKVIYYERGLVPHHFGKDDTFEGLGIDVKGIRFRDGDEDYDVEGPSTLIIDITDAELEINTGDESTVMAPTFNHAGVRLNHDRWPVLVKVVERFEESERVFIEVNLEMKDEA